MIKGICGIFTSFSPDPDENRAHQLGRYGEDLAARFLQAGGFKVLYRNFRASHGGEIDIVCRDKELNTLVFVEVKTRSSVAHGSVSSITRMCSSGSISWKLSCATGGRRSI